MRGKLKKHAAPDGGWCDRNYWKQRADERAADLAAKDAELARLKAKVTRIRDHVERGGAHPELTAAVILCGEILGYYPSPAEAGEKACKCGHADVDHNDPFLGKRFCFECEGDCPPAAKPETKGEIKWTS